MLCCVHNMNYRGLVKADRRLPGVVYLPGTALSITHTVSELTMNNGPVFAQ